MTDPIDRRPTVLSSGLAVGAATVAAGAAGLSGTLGLAGGAAGLLAVAAGVARGSRRLVTLGGAALLAGVLLGGVTGGTAETLLVGTMAAVLCWDFGEQAISLGEQLGRAADTRRLELAHAAASTVVAVAGGGLGYGVYVAGTGGQPVTALVFLLVAAVALASALRN